MFHPNYTISPALLRNIKQIATLVFSLNSTRLSKPVLMEFMRQAREISAYASTSIEGNPLPLTEVKRILKARPEQIRDSEREVLNYNKALVWLESFSQNQVAFDLPLILTIHNIVMEGLIPDFKCGTLRKEPVFVNDPSLKKPVYWPPDHQDVESLMKKLFHFITLNNGKIDPLILSGIFHKQFVIIHPFPDGNGRTVRLATKVLLSAMGINTFPLFSFENYYNQNVSKYFQFVGVKGNYYDLSQNVDFTTWLEYFTDGIIDELLRVSKAIERKSVTPQTILLAHHQKILQYLQEHDFITDKIYSTLTERAKPTRNQDINRLIGMGLIERVGKGKATFYRLKNTF